jgi:hypothetical protein
MSNTTKSLIKYTSILAVIAGLFAGNFAYAAIDSERIVKNANGDTEALVCSVLAEIGLGCVGKSASNNTSAGNSSSGNNTNNSTVQNSNQNINIGGGFSSAFNSSLLKASTFTGKISRKFSGNEVSLIKSRNSSEIYEIIGGKRHVIPNEEIFYDYGYKPEMVRLVDQSEVNRYPRVRLVSVKGKKDVYYLTEGGMIRLLPDPRIYQSYGSSKEDIVEISKKEFNYYPQNKYIYQESPLNKDVFMIANGVKKYLTPMAIRRMGVKEYMVAPVNQFEFDYYKIGEPVIN